MKAFVDALAMLVGGALFGFGLALSGMIQPEVVLSFLRLQDFGLMLVMGGAIAVTATVYFFAPRRLTRPLWGAAFMSRITTLDADLIRGSALFGIGWGLSGVCPGPAIAALGTGNLELLWSVAGLFVGAFLHGLLRSRPREAAVN